MFILLRSKNMTNASIKSVSDETNIDGIAISETWLSGEIADNRIRPASYTCIRSDRSQYMDGVMTI